MAQGKTPPAAKTTGPARKAQAQKPSAEAKAPAAVKSPGEAKGASKAAAPSSAGAEGKQAAPAEVPSTARRTPKAQGAVKTIKVTQVRSGIGFDRKQTLALRGLGLRRIRHSVEVPDTPGARGLILKVRHLVTVTE